MALTNPTKYVSVQRLARFEEKLAAKYQTQAITAITGLNAGTVEEALAELLGKIASEISAVYKPAGSIAASGLTSSLLVAGNLGKVYNLTDNATTDENWLEGAGKTVEAGTDVGIVAVDNSGTTVYKFNAYGTKTDLSGYKTKQTAVTDPTASGKALSFIDSISQNANGEITVTKKTVDDASASAAGLMSSSDYSKLAALPTNSELETALGGKADKVSGATNGNFAALDGNGNLTDSGKKASDFQAAGSYKTTQTAVSDPSADGTGLTFIDSISQDTNGVITPHKKTVANVSASTSGTGGSAGLMIATDKEKLDNLLECSNDDIDSIFN
jgi:hypothetical protein